MGDAAGERADRLHLLRVNELLLHILARCHFRAEAVVGGAKLAGALAHPSFELLRMVRQFRVRGNEIGSRQFELAVGADGFLENRDEEIEDLRTVRRDGEAMAQEHNVEAGRQRGIPARAYAGEDLFDARDQSPAS